MTTSSKEWALLYSQLDWKIIPVHSVNEYTGGCSCGSVEKYHGVGKAPYTAHNHRDASKDPIQISLWWEIYPEANVAIATGQPSGGLIAIDIDAAKSGYRSWDAIQRKFGEIPKTVTASSGGGGKHYYFKHFGKEIRGRQGMRPGIDVMADGGRIIAPPSRHKSGNRYTWENSPLDFEVAELPFWLLNMIRTPNSKKPRVPKVRAYY